MMWRPFVHTMSIVVAHDILFEGKTSSANEVVTERIVGSISA